MDLVSFGIKLFGILQLLIQRNLITPKSYLLLEEPDAHLHSALMAKFTEVVKELVKKGVHVIITTHRPGLVRCFRDMITTEELDPDQCSFLGLKLDEDHQDVFGKSQPGIKGAENILASLDE